MNAEKLKGKEIIEDLAKKAARTHRGFQAQCKKMTIEQARIVKSFRADQGCTWRAVAERCHELWGEEWESWFPTSNQLMGMALCETAARLLGEDPDLEPWN